jgi:hypothetical protein
VVIRINLKGGNDQVSMCATRSSIQLLEERKAGIDKVAGVK